MHSPTKEIMEEVQKNFGIMLDKWVLYRVRNAAHKLLHGSMRDHYYKLQNYIKELKRSNLESTFILHTKPAVFMDIPMF